MFSSCQLVQYVFIHGPFKKTETKSFMLSSQWIFIKRQPMHNLCIIALGTGGVQGQVKGQRLMGIKAVNDSIGLATCQNKIYEK